MNNNFYPGYGFPPGSQYFYPANCYNYYLSNVANNGSYPFIPPSHNQSYRGQSLSSETRQNSQQETHVPSQNQFYENQTQSTKRRRKAKNTYFKNVQVLDPNYYHYQNGVQNNRNTPGTNNCSWVNTPSSRNRHGNIEQQNPFPASKNHSGRQITNNCNTPNKNIVFQERGKFLNFFLEDIFCLGTELKITEDDRTNFQNKFVTYDDGKNLFCRLMSHFCTNVDGWCRKQPNKNEVLNIAKYSLVLVENFGDKALCSIVANTSNRLAGIGSLWSPTTNRMILIYLIYLIVLIEARPIGPIYFTPKSKLYCKKFEEVLSNSQNDYFRNLVKKGDHSQKQELYSMRCKWNCYFSKNSLANIDRNDFWWHEGKDAPTESWSIETIGVEDWEEDWAPTIQTAAVSTSSSVSNIIEIDGTEDNDTDDTSFVIQAIDNILILDWLAEFPINEEDKRRFTEKYSVTKPTGKDGVMYSNKIVEFNTAGLQNGVDNVLLLFEKEKIIDLAKEAFYLEKVFGSIKVLDIAKILISRLVACEAELSLIDRLITLLLIHIILSAEAKKSSYKNEIKDLRPFSKAFSNDDFVMNFRHLVTCVNSKRSKQKLYYMRLVWNFCLLKEWTDKIDEDNFWWNAGVQETALPTRMDLEKQTDTLVSADNDEDVLIVGSIDKSQKQNEEDVCIVLPSSDDDDDDDNDVGTTVRQKDDGYDNYVRETSGQEMENDNHNNHSVIFGQSRFDWVWSDNENMLVQQKDNNNEVESANQQSIGKDDTYTTGQQTNDENDNDIEITNPQTDFGIEIPEEADDEDEINEIESASQVTDENEDTNNNANNTDEENDSEVEIIGQHINNEEDSSEMESSENENERENESCYITLFQQQRQTLWALNFSMDDEAKANLWKKYKFTDSKTKSKNKKGKNYPVLDSQMAMEIFTKTVISVFPPTEISKFLEAAKEAFFIEKEFGCGAEVVKFLVPILQNGFPYETKWKLCYQLTAFLIIHIIIAVASTDSFIGPNMAKNFYTKAFAKEKTYLKAQKMSRHITDRTIREKLQNLTKTWISWCERRHPIPQDVTAVFKDMSNLNLEGVHINDILVYAKGKYKNQMATSVRPETVRCVEIMEKKLHEKKLEQAEIENRNRGDGETERQAETEVVNNDLEGPEYAKTEVPSSSKKINILQKESSSGQSDHQLTYKKHEATDENIRNSDQLEVNGLPLDQKRSQDEESEGLGNEGKSTRKIEGRRKRGNETGGDKLRSKAAKKGKVIQDVTSDEFIDNLLIGNLDFVFSDKGLQVKTIYKK